MDAFILAAGRGKRLRPLTDTLPKPLIPVGDSTLIEARLRTLAAAGITHVVVNHAHLGQQIIQHLGDGSRYGVRISYSDESSGALGTAGGIIKALPLLQSDPFLVVNSDIWTDYPFANLPSTLSGLAHLILVDNPAHNLNGDFCLHGDRVAKLDDCVGRRVTFAGIGVYQRALFTDLTPSILPLAPLLITACDRKLVSGEYYAGVWMDIGTPSRLEMLNDLLIEQESD
jgi:MurNAc alpha-1-phosphate uridylyltransferase